VIESFKIIDNRWEWLKSHFPVVLKGLIDIKPHYFIECFKKTLGGLKIGAWMTCPTIFPN
jgi:hypothetical protein